MILKVLLLKTACIYCVHTHTQTCQKKIQVAKTKHGQWQWQPSFAELDIFLLFPTDCTYLDASPAAIPHLSSPTLAIWLGNDNRVSNAWLMDSSNSHHFCWHGKKKHGVIIFTNPNNAIFLGQITQNHHTYPYISIHLIPQKNRLQ